MNPSDKYNSYVNNGMDKSTNRDLNDHVGQIRVGNNENPLWLQGCTLSYNARVCDVNAHHLQNRNYSQVRMNGCTYLAYKYNNIYLIHLSETASLTVTTAAWSWLQQQSLARVNVLKFLSCTPLLSFEALFI